MWALVVTVDIPGAMSGEEAREGVERDLVPMAPTLPGFVRSAWMRHERGGVGLGVHFVKTEGDARAIAAQIEVGGEGGGGTTVRSVEVYEIIAEV